MTEERKRELRRLLEEAMEDLEIRSRLRDRDSSPVDVHTYRQYLQQLWTFYPSYSLWGPMSFEPEIASKVTESKMIGFIRDEFAPFIHEDKILSARRFLQGGLHHGLPLERPLAQLLKIGVVKGIGEAVSAFDAYVRGTHEGSFQYIALLSGVTLRTETQVFEGIRLVPLPNSTSELPRYMPDPSFLPFGFFASKYTVLIIDLFVSPILPRPLPRTIQEYSNLVNPLFRDEVSSGKRVSLKEEDFYKTFCQALSLTYNLAIDTVVKWRFSAETEFFHPYSDDGIVHNLSPIGSPTEVTDDQKDKAIRIYNLLVNPSSDVVAKLKIPIDRWIKSKAGTDPVNKIIDLGIALEALYVQDGGGDITYKFAIRAARHLGADKEDPGKLLKKLKDIYKCRSDAVHSGTLDPDARFGETRIPISEFIERAQLLCRQSIIQIVEDAKEDAEFPEWDSLILGSKP